MPISKTDYVRALQCKKMLWLDAHRPEKRVIPPEVQEKLDAGNAFGDNAMEIFGDFVETTAFREDGRLHFSKMLEQTKTLLQQGAPVICEAAFSWYGNYCAADILKKEPDGYVLYEVKNAPSVRKEFIVDLGFQSLILRKCGVEPTATKLILNGANETARDTLNFEYIEHKNQLYKIADVTKAVKLAERTASRNVFEFGKLKKQDEPAPSIDIGDHCETPYRCWYYEYCQKTSTRR